MEKTPHKLALITKYFTDFTGKQLEQFGQLNELYKDWNSRINVISRKDIDSLYQKHVLHSLSIAATFEFKPGTHIIDIGTGGGFPGIPLAVFFPEIKFHLVDSIAKKIKVVDAIVSSLNLGNVTTQHGRVEEIKNQKPYGERNRYDFAVSRAVATLSDLWNWSNPLLKKESAINKFPPGLICLKGGDLANEIKESRLKPRIIEITEIFSEDYFREKYILYIPCGS